MVANSSEGFVEKCLFSQPDSGVEEVACGIAKNVAEVGILVTTCYAADALATGFFPPAAALAPLCNVLGITNAGQKTAEAVLH